MSTTSTPGSERRYATRPEERQQLEELNTRLAAYIHRVKELQEQNESLEEQITVLRHSRTTLATVATKEMEQELLLAKKQLSEENEETAKVKLEIVGLTDNFQRLKKDLQLTEKEHDKLKKQLMTTVENLQSSKAQAQAAEHKLALQINSNAALRQKIAELEAALQQQKETANAELLKHVSLRNKVTDLTEQLEAKEKAHAAMIVKLEEEIQQSTIIRVQKDQSAKDKFNEDLAQALAQAKAHYLEAVEVLREEMQAHYEAKAARLPAPAAPAEILALRATIDEWRVKHSILESELAAAATEIASYKKRVKSLETSINAIRIDTASEIQKKQDIIVRLTSELKEKEVIYNDLLDQRIKLDAEIDYYRKLLNGEYTRLSMPNSPATSTKALLKRSASSTPSVATSAKAAAVAIEQAGASYLQKVTTTGNVALEDLDSENGYYVSVKNITQNNITITGWTLTVSNGTDSATYKFPARSKLTGGEIKRIVSAKGQSIQQEGDIFWASFDQIEFEEQCTITLKDKTGTVVSEMEITRDEFPGGVGTGDALLHDHAQAAKKAKVTSSNCEIM